MESTSTRFESVSLNAFEAAQAAAGKVGLTINRTEKKPGAGEHWMFEHNGQRVMDYWPKTLKAYFPNTASSFIVTGDAQAIMAAELRQVPPQPTKQEYQRMKSIRGQTFNYPPELKGSHRRKRRHKRKAK